MTDKDSIADPKPPLHPAYTVTNIQNKVRTLDGVKVTYSSWVKLFKLHAKAYKVLDHVDGTTPPNEETTEYAAWAEIDALILQWLYATLSDDLLVRVLETDATARSTRVKLEHIFLNNKSSRATTLEHEFTNLTVSIQCISPFIRDAYCSIQTRKSFENHRNYYKDQDFNSIFIFYAALIIIINFPSLFLKF
ncbi:hypothetical protein HanRHA438_Chr08g0335771 [Helianthus annuus]|nr:hypothetical protein HanIR_Chr08g0350561 [Helianthus annuus]KAJ0896539.1 hypothetical protein HanRHA438_Chr08g0335771 [Helianthus annuus]